MGRPYTGADYTTSALRLDIGKLIRWGLLRKGSEAQIAVRYTNGAEVTLWAKYTDTVRQFHVRFHLKEDTGQVETWTQEVELQTVPSNLGKGELLYFLCPRTRKRCRIIYRAYHSKGFYSREGFRYPLYYPVQASSYYKKIDRQYWRAEAKLEALQAKRRTSTYNGIPTRRAVRLEKLMEEVCRLDEIRWSPQYMPVALRGIIFEEKLL